MKRQTLKQKLEKDLKDYQEYAQKLEPYSYEFLEGYGESLPPLEEWKLEDFYPPKVFNSWQEALLDMAEGAEVETLERSAHVARRILNALPLKERTQKEKLFRDHLKTLSEYV